jgi:hypothetical protein
MIIELMEDVADWACDTADARPEMWLQGFRQTMPVLSQPHYRAGVASIAVERIFQYDIRWRAGTYKELPPGTLAHIVFRSQEPSTAGLLNQSARNILDCLFSAPVSRLLKSQLALADVLDRELSDGDSSAADAVRTNIARRLLIST